MAYRSDLIDVRGTATHLYRGGHGDPVLVLHAEFCADTWSPFHDRLAGGFRVVAPDHPGFGRSERPEWIETIDDLVFHYVDLLDALELERVRVLGMSLGGWIAADLALRHPERVHSLVLAAPAGVRVEGVSRFDLFAAPIEETLRHLVHDPARIPALLPAESGPDILLRAYRESTSLARLAWNPYFYDRKLQERLTRLRVPTLLVWGERDSLLPIRHGEEFARLVPNARLRRLPDCGHLIHIERPEELARAASEFFGGTSRSENG